jgi:hypothetical protein
VLSIARSSGYRLCQYATADLRLNRPGGAGAIHTLAEALREHGLCLWPDEFRQFARLLCGRAGTIGRVMHAHPGRSAQEQRFWVTAVLIIIKSLAAERRLRVSGGLKRHHKAW